MSAIVKPFVKKGSYNPEEMLAYAERHHGKEIPQLPTAPFFMLHNLPEINEMGGKYGKGFARAECDLKELEIIFNCHFPGRPLLPGSMMLESIFQLAGFWLVWNGTLRGEGVALGFGPGRFKDKIRPEAETIQILIDVKRVTRASSVHTIFADGQVKKADGTTAFAMESATVGVILPK